MNNETRFKKLKELNLPIDQYAIIGSGPLGIRNLREIGDIDLVVTPKLQSLLAKKYPIFDKKIIFPKMDIEAFWEDSFDAPILSVETIMQNAEIIDELPFISLEHLLIFKKTMHRAKDLEDIHLIEEWQKIKG